MEIIVRTFAIYLILLILFRIMGKRSMTQLTAFDFILFLIISEALQNALVDEDRSVVMGLAVVLTFVMLDLGMAILKKRYKPIEALTEGTPVILVDHGKVFEDRLSQVHVSKGDILQVARQSQGLERMDQIKYAVLEAAGGISIIPIQPDIEGRLARIEAALARVAPSGSTPSS